MKINMAAVWRSTNTPNPILAKASAASSPQFSSSPSKLLDEESALEEPPANKIVNKKYTHGKKIITMPASHTRDCERCISGGTAIEEKLSCTVLGPVPCVIIGALVAIG
ncbi:hypothetical protein V5S96_02625 [Corynebacterium mastitidis]|uniref:Uncharacterized protein n=2 Tax=Corynebacterium mastitidis TaxID=161890 RepID=A0ABU8NW68_9CORY